MINAIAGFSDIGAALTLSKAGLTRRAEAPRCAVCGGNHPPGADHSAGNEPKHGSIQGVNSTQNVDPTRPLGPLGQPQKPGETNPAQVADIVEFSSQGLAAAKRAENEIPGQQLKTHDDLTEEEQQQVQELRKRDTEVRAHEQAHKASGGAHAGGISYEYQTGPDGKRYAVGGEVAIDVSPVKGDPRATIQKMQQVRRAASAPAQPSSADRQVAAKAAQLEAQARAELAKQTSEEPAGGAAAPSTPSVSTSSATSAAGVSGRQNFESPRVDLYA